MVVIDTLERLAALELWLFDHFIPTLPEDSVVLLASRLPPSRAVLRDIGWHQMMTEIALAGLSIDEARTLLVAQGLDAALTDPLYRVSAGNPLVLALGVDHLRRGAACRSTLPASKSGSWYRSSGILSTTFRAIGITPPCRSWPRRGSSTVRCSRPSAATATPVRSISGCRPCFCRAGDDWTGPA